MRREPLMDEMRRYLETGNYLEGEDGFGNGRFATFLLAGHVMRGHLDELRRIWDAYGAEVKRRHPGVTFAERVLRGEAQEDERR
jgi:hypothetical protein